MTYSDMEAQSCLTAKKGVVAYPRDRQWPQQLYNSCVSTLLSRSTDHERTNKGYFIVFSHWPRCVFHRLPAAFNKPVLLNSFFNVFPTQADWPDLLFSLGMQCCFTHSLPWVSCEDYRQAHKTENYSSSKGKLPIIWSLCTVTVTGRNIYKANTIMMTPWEKKITRARGVATAKAAMEIVSWPSVKLHD